MAGASPDPAEPTTPEVRADDGFDTFVTPAEVVALQERLGDDLVILDVRAGAAYAEGHLPNAINLAGGKFRTGKANPGEGDSQYVFRDGDGQPDVARYEQLLGDAGITIDKTVVVYGNHGGKGDGSLPAMLLDWLGQERVLFLDGIAIDEWTAAGFELVTDPTTLEPATYVASPRDGFIWNLSDVQAGLASGVQPVFYDTRSAEEFAGAELRDNVRGGHIPGAIHADYTELLTGNKWVRPRAEIEAMLVEQGLPNARDAGRPIVLYCQTATRVSLAYLVLRELGYENIAIYDASWHEYGNRDDTAIETPSAVASAGSAADR